MPLYEYVCHSCGKSFEVIAKFSDEPPKQCPSCGSSDISKKVGVPSIRFKGSGWYITDYANGHSSAGAAATSDSSPPPSDSKSDAGNSSTANSKKSVAAGE